jgi:hypothetical protein
MLINASGDNRSAHPRVNSDFCEFLDTLSAIESKHLD